MAPLGLRHAVLGATLLVLFGSWVPVVAIATALLAAHYWYSDRVALSAMCAVEVGPEEEPRLHPILTRLCTQADMPKPALAIATTDIPAAFATGRTPTHAVLCVTTGLTEHLTDDEIEAVLARELSRLAHRDALVTAITPLIPLLAGLLVRLPFHTAPLGETSWQTDPTFGTGLIALTLSVYALGFLLARALSRHRELAADRDGALLTGQPYALARALAKLEDASTAIPTRDLRTAKTLKALVFNSAGRRSRSLLATCPDLDTRLDRLANPKTVPEARSRSETGRSKTGGAPGSQ